MLTIADVEVYYDGSGTPQVMTGPLPLQVTATPTAVPLHQLHGGLYQEDQLAKRLVAVNPSTGAWQLQLPWPSETRFAAGTELWQVRRVSGSLYQGYVPEGVPGPVTLDVLVQSYGSQTTYKWQVVASGASAARQVVAVAGPQGYPNTLPLPWNTSTFYSIGNGVLGGNGNGYVCLVAHSGHQPPNAAYWTCYVVGANGLP